MEVIKMKTMMKRIPALFVLVIMLFAVCIPVSAAAAVNETASTVELSESAETNVRVTRS